MGILKLSSHGTDVATIAHSVMDIATIGECAEKNQPSTNPNMNVSLTFSICKATIKYLDIVKLSKFSVLWREWSKNLVTAGVEAGPHKETNTHYSRLTFNYGLILKRIE